MRDRAASVAASPTGQIGLPSAATIRAPTVAGATGSTRVVGAGLRARTAVEGADGTLYRQPGCPAHPPRWSRPDA